MTASATEMLQTYGVGLIIVPLISFMEAIAIGKAFSRINNYKIIPTQELIALGVANIMSSFVSAYPVTGSFSRTAVNCQSGVKTPLAGMLNSILYQHKLTCFEIRYILFDPSEYLTTYIHIHIEVSLLIVL